MPLIEQALSACASGGSTLARTARPRPGLLSAGAPLLVPFTLHRSSVGCTRPACPARPRAWPSLLHLPYTALPLAAQGRRPQHGRERGPVFSRRPPSAPSCTSLYPYLCKSYQRALSRHTHTKPVSESMRLRTQHGKGALCDAGACARGRCTSTAAAREPARWAHSRTSSDCNRVNAAGVRTGGRCTSTAAGRGPTRRARCRTPTSTCAAGARACCGSTAPTSAGTGRPPARRHVPTLPYPMSNTM